MLEAGHIVGIVSIGDVGSGWSATARRSAVADGYSRGADYGGQFSVRAGSDRRQAVALEFVVQGFPVDAEEPGQSLLPPALPGSTQYGARKLFHDGVSLLDERS